MHDILILGSEGFIGSNMVTYFLGKKWKVAGIDHADNPKNVYDYHKLLSINDFTEFLLNNQFAYIVNAAGSGNVGFSVSHPLGDFQSNCFETAKILDSMRIANYRGIYLHISSAAVYGDPQKLPVNEEDHPRPLSPYGWHKLMSEMLCREYFELYGIRSCIVRPFSVFGPGLRKQLFWDIYHRSVGNHALELFGTGNESRDFIYITDLVRAIDLLLAKAAMKAECYNVASGVETTIASAAGHFIRNFPDSVSLTFNGRTKAGDPLNWRADITKLVALGFQPETRLEDGVKLTFSWIEKISRNNYL
jgi:UDP-glucose 4-epimerase